MIIADRWKDIEVFDTSGGEKLERWGDVVLVRPDPQVIWNTKRSHPGWKKYDGRYIRSAKGGGEWDDRSMPDEWDIGYELITGKKLRFHIKPFAFKHTGVFPEQAVNWDWFSSIIEEEVSRRKRSGDNTPVKVLNLFAYTGGATISAAASGAEVVHVDASKGMTGWAKDNAILSGLGDAPIRYFVDDCLKLVEREIRRGNKYDGIIMDPPSYGRGPKGEIWKLEESLWPFMEKVSELVSDKPLFFLLNSYTTGLQPGVLTYILSKTVLKSHKGTVTADEIGLPVSGSSLVLPCGASGRVLFDNDQD